jgi:hypothetical protein
VGLGPVFFPAADRPEAPTINDRARPIDLIRGVELGQEYGMELLPDPCVVPIAEAPPAGHAGAAAHLLGEHLPGNAGLQDKENTG